MKNQKTTVEQYQDEKFDQAYWLTVLNRDYHNGDLFRNFATVAVVFAILVAGLHLPEIFRVLPALMAN